MKMIIFENNVRGKCSEGRLFELERRYFQILVSKCVRKFHKECLLSICTKDQQGGNSINLVKAFGFDTKKDFLAADCYKQMWCGENGVMQSCHLSAVKIV